MEQYFRMHRIFQLLKWIDGLNQGYESPDRIRRPTEGRSRENPHRPPTISNLAYYLLTHADYNEAALEEKFSSRAIRGTPEKDVFTYVKRDLTRHLAQYPGDLFKTHPVKKVPIDHPTFEAGLESRQVEAKAYYLSKHGQDRLEDLTDVMEFKRDLITSQETVTSEKGSIKYVNKTHQLNEKAIERIQGEVDSKKIETDSIIIPVETRRRWKTETYTLPRVAVADSDRNQPLKVYRD